MENKSDIFSNIPNKEIYKPNLKDHLTCFLVTFLYIDYLYIIYITRH